MRRFKSWTKNRAEKPAIKKNKKIAHLLLPEGAVTTNGRVLRVEHGGHIHEVPLKTKKGKAIAVVRDPVRKERPLVLRLKRDGKRKVGYDNYKLGSVWRGKETNVGFLDFHRKGYLRGISVYDEVRRKENSKGNQDEGRKQKALEYLKEGKFDGIGELLNKPNDEIYSGLIKHLPKFLEKGVIQDMNLSKTNLTKWFMSSPDIFEGKVREYNYRRHGLSHFMTTVLEDAAKRDGITRLSADFAPETTGKFMPRYGWKRTIAGNAVRHEKVL